MFKIIGFSCLNTLKSAIFNFKKIFSSNRLNKATFLIFFNLLFCAPESSISINGVLQNILGAGVSYGLKGSIIGGEIPLNSSRTVINLNTPVIPGRTLVLCNIQYGGSEIGYSSTCDLDETGSSLIIQTGGFYQDSRVKYNLLEFNSYLSVVRDATTFPNNTLSKVITLSVPISLSKYSILSSARASGSQVDADESILIKNKFLSSTQIELRRKAFNVEANSIFQIIKYENSKIQSGDVEIPNGVNTITSTITPVNLDKSFLVFSLSPVNGVSREADYMVQGKFLNNSTLEFSRAGTNIELDISFFVFEFIGNEKVHSGHLLGVTQTSITQSLPAPLKDPSRSLLIFSNSNSPSNNPNEDKQSSSYIGNILDANTIQFSRKISNNTSSNISYFIIEFP